MILDKCHCDLRYQIPLRPLSLDYNTSTVPFGFARSLKLTAGYPWIPTTMAKHIVKATKIRNRFQPGRVTSFWPSGNSVFCVCVCLKIRGPRKIKASNKNPALVLKSILVDFKPKTQIHVFFVFSWILQSWDFDPSFISGSHVLFYKSIFLIVVDDAVLW